MTVPTPDPSLRPGGFLPFTNVPPRDIVYLMINGGPTGLGFFISGVVDRQEFTSGLPGNGDTLDLIAARVPLKLTVTVTDTSGGYPGVDTDTDYDMGPSNPSQSFSLGASEAITKIVAGVRF